MAIVEKLSHAGIEAGSARRRRLSRLTAVLGCTAMTAPLFMTPALAQEAEATVDDNTIIVTAQRRSEALEDVPMTVNVLSQETLANSGVTSVRDLATVTTGYQLGQAGSVPQPAIRGVTSLINGAYENNVAVYIDGLYQTVPAAISIDLPNINAVQVLKGPQGTLYGRNATGGAILIDTINPGASWEGKAELTYARFDDKRVSGYIAGPLNDIFGISLAGYWRRTDGYHKKLSRTTPGEYEGNTFGLDQDAFRGKLTANFTDSFRAALGYSYLRSNDPRGIQFSPLANAPASYNLPGGRIPGGAGGGPFLLPTKLGETAYDFDPKIEVKQHEAFLKLELDTGIGKLQSISGWQRTTTETNYDFDGSYLPAFYGTGKPKDTTIQQTIDYNINAIEGLDLIVGGQYFNIKTAPTAPTRQYFGYVFRGITNYTYSGTEIPLSTYSIANDQFFFRKKEAWAIYGDATLHLSDRFTVNVGGRYSKEDQHVYTTKIGTGGVGVGTIIYDPTKSLRDPVTGLYNGPGANKRSSYKKFTPRASIRYEIEPRTSVYASYSKGFKSGEWNTTFPLDNPNLWFDVNQESIDAFEVGLKSAGSRLRFDVAGFYYDYTDLQVSTTTFVPGFGTQTLLQNAPKAKIYGAEANFEYEVVDNLNIRAGATWLHARYGDGFVFTGVSVNPAGTSVSPANGNPLNALPNVNITQDLSGQQMARSPNFSAYAGIDYLIPNEDGGLRFTLNAKYTDSYVPTNPSIWGGDPTYNPANANEVVNNEEQFAGRSYIDQSNKQRFRQGKYVLLNASVTWTDPTDHYYVRLWGNNLTDKRYRLHYAGTSTFGTYSPMGEPLTFGATVGFKFREDEAPPPPVTAPPPPPPPPPPPVAEVVCNKGPYIVFFDWDKSDITAEAATILDSAIGAYGNCQSVPIMLAGYADRSGSVQYNQGLSERRNASTRSYLTARGIPDGAISSQAFGESNPRVPTADGVRELQNRRVEITYGPGSGM